MYVRAYMRMVCSWTKVHTLKPGCSSGEGEKAHVSLARQTLQRWKPAGTDMHVCVCETV